LAGTSILEAIREAVGEETEVVHEPNPTASTLLELHQQKEPFSYAIVVVGEAPYAEFFGDRNDLSIPFNGHDTISLIAGTIPTVVLVVSGRPLVLEAQLLEQIEALVAVWLPGSEGSGVADCLFGDYDFHGVLPVSWFRSVDQLPLNSGMGAAYNPLFPIGFGLRMFDKP
jgi:beta-glucosidase